MHIRMRSAAPEVLNIVYQEPDEGGVVLSLGLALPAGLTLRGSCTSKDTSSTTG